MKLHNLFEGTKKAPKKIKENKNRLAKLKARTGMSNADIDKAVSKVVENDDYIKGPVEAYGVRGMKSKPWRKKFKSLDALWAWVEKMDGDVEVQNYRALEEGIEETVDATDYNPPSLGGTRKELLAKFAKTKDPKDATLARKAGATQVELRKALHEMAPGGDQLNVGDKVHLGFKQMGGAGFDGVIVDIDDENVTIKNDNGHTYKGPIKNVTKEGAGEVDEGYKILPPINDRYQKRDGLEGPFRADSGKVLYYDPREGKYYDPDTDMYLSHEEYEMHSKPGSVVGEGWGAEKQKRDHQASMAAWDAMLKKYATDAKMMKMLKDYRTKNWTAKAAEKEALSKIKTHNEGIEDMNVSVTSRGKKGTGFKTEGRLVLQSPMGKQYSYDPVKHKHDFNQVMKKLPELKKKGWKVIQMPPKNVKEDDGTAMMTKLKGLQPYVVYIKNNYYNGKYPDYSARPYIVLARSPEDAKQVVLSNADAILQVFLQKKLHGGRRVLPPRSALPITEKSIGLIELASDRLKPTTPAPREFFSPEGKIKVKLNNGEIVEPTTEAIVPAGDKYSDYEYMDDETGQLYKDKADVDSWAEPTSRKSKTNKWAIIGAFGDVASGGGDPIDYVMNKYGVDMDQINAVAREQGYNDANDWAASYQETESMNESKLNLKVLAQWIDEAAAETDAIKEAVMKRGLARAAKKAGISANDAINEACKKYLGAPTLQALQESFVLEALDMITEDLAPLDFTPGDSKFSNKDIVNPERASRQGVSPVKFQEAWRKVASIAVKIGRREIEVSPETRRKVMDRIDSIASKAENGGVTLNPSPERVRQLVSGRR